MPLEPGDVLARRAEGVPEVHIAGAADELAHLAATEADPLREDSPLMALARIGAQAMMTRVELDADRNAG